MKPEQIMNAISGQARTGTGSGFMPGTLQIAADLGLTPARPLPAWLPVPAPSRPKAHVGAVQARRPLPGAVRQSGAEKFWLLVLAVAALVGIGYGFSCLLDLVQHWAVFNAGVAHLLQ